MPIDEAFPPIQTVIVKEEVVMKTEVKPETNISSESNEDEMVPQEERAQCHTSLSKTKNFIQKNINFIAKIN